MPAISRNPIGKRALGSNRYVGHQFETMQKNLGSASIAGNEHLSFPCSPEQRRFWVWQELDPRNPSLNLARRWRVEGKLSHANLERVFQTLVTRHASLRTFFSAHEGEPHQVVAAHVPFLIPAIDLTALPESDALIEAQRIAQLEAGVTFDISIAPLLRVTHLRLRDQVSILLVTAHRLIADETALTILAREMGEIGTAVQAGQVPVLPAVPIRHGEFAHWQVARLAHDRAHAEEEYWSKVLLGIKHFEIPPDRPRSSIQTASVGVQSVLLDRELSEGLVELARGSGCSLLQTALTAWFALLYRYSGETDIAIGSQFSGREEDGFDLKNLVGPLATTLVIRQDLSDDPSFVTLLARSRAAVSAAHEHRHVSLDRLIEIVNPVRDWSRHPLFSVNFTFQESFIESQDFGNLRLRELPSYPCGARYDLNLIIQPYAQGWRVACEYNDDLFEGPTIAGILKHFTQLLRAALAAPEQKISGLAILDDVETHSLVVDANRTEAEYPAQLTLPQLFMAQAAHTPDAIAVVCGARRLSYRELDEASNRLAQVLQHRGLAPASRIGVFLDRSPDLLVALLGILKAGSAYIPLDPIYPAERIRQVFENSRPAAVITRQALRDRLPLGDTPAIAVDAEPALAEALAVPPPGRTATPSDLAYLIYTSGSTGRPKGVQIAHQALVNLLWAMRREPGMSNADTVLSVTSIAFDIAALEMFLPIIVGAKLVIASEDQVNDGAALLQLLQQHNATWMQATPITWQILLAAGWRGDPALKILCGGEALTRQLADSLLACGDEVWNMYGPTETTIWSAGLRVSAGDGPVPIGPPIANTQFYILDRHGNLAPPGVAGELFIGGDGVALGYFDLPELTQEKFVVDKFSHQPGARLYRTGDIMRRRQPGQFEYLGRADHQVKLRGFRIELGEIEALLLQHAGISEAVAVLGQDSSGQAAIWAYVVAPPAAKETQDGLRDALRARLTQSLPAYMRPSAIEILPALPRTPNGKIDRRSLPVPSPLTAPDKELRLPGSETEQRLAKIWATVLGAEDIDVTMDFFESGGNSLLATRLMVAIETEFGKRLSLAALFQAPSIAQQAKLLEHSDARQFDFRQVVRLQPNGSNMPLIAIHNTGVYYYHLSKRLGPEQPLIALQLFDPSIQRSTLPGSIEAIAAEYVQLIQQFQPRGPYALLGWCVGGILAFEVARQLKDLQHEVKLLALIDSWAPGHLTRLPRWRARLFDYFYRLKLIVADWRRVTSYQQSVMEFLSHRTVFKIFLRAFGYESVDAVAPVAFGDRNLNPVNYDQWLLGYLDNLALHYTPKSYSGKITLLCSATEPRGLFIDPKMGWGGFAAQVDVQVIDGDHFTMFQGKGQKQMALHIAAALEQQTDRRKPSCTHEEKACLS